MAVFRKLYQPLWSWNFMFYRSTHILPQLIANTRKSIPLNIIIANNADIYDKIHKEDLFDIEWQSIREKLLQVQNITATTVDSIIMDMCLRDFQVDRAIKYYIFLKENNYPLNTAIIGKYLRLYVLKKNLTEADNKEIVTTYNILREKHPYLDAITAEHCIISLCLTNKWKKSFELIDMIKLTTVPGKSVYSALASAAFRNGEPAIAWEALAQICFRKLIPQDNVYTSHLKFCEQEGKQTFDARMEEMFMFWSENSIMPCNRIISAYADVADKYGWSAKVTTISKTGSCKQCSHSLSEITFSKETFQKLVESVMKKIIIGSDIYHKTNPVELQKFMNFVNKTKPYDIVIDGLNLTYFKKGFRPNSKTLIEVVDYFSKRGKKILVLTRKHQKKMSFFKYIQKNALVFMIDDLSSDDPYMLYATMASGSNAMFVSVDLLRQHKYSLKDPYLEREFKKWQYSHQYSVRSKNPYDIQEPFIYMPIAHKSADHWHIPYVADDFTYADLYEFPDKWYCFHNRGEK